jgi:hypothetical protein
VRCGRVVYQSSGYYAGAVVTQQYCRDARLCVSPVKIREILVIRRIRVSAYRLPSGGLISTALYRGKPGIAPHVLPPAPELALERVQVLAWVRASARRR